MKEYKVTMTFSIEARKADYEKISDYAERLSNLIISKLNDDNDIDIVEASVDEIEDHNDYDDGDYLNEDED